MENIIFELNIELEDELDESYEDELMDLVLGDVVHEVQIGDQIALKSGKGLAKIEVYANEGPIPHFHVKSNNIESCLKIFSPEYFLHRPGMVKLGKQNLKILNEALKKPCVMRNIQRIDIKYISVWHAIVAAWKEHYKPGAVKEVDEQPDYTKAE